MQIGQNLKIHQTQKLIMTPELRQAITVLQLSVPELEDFVEEQLLENPLLDLKEEDKAEETAAEHEKKLNEFDWWEYFRDGTDWGENLPPRERDEKLNFENMVMQLPTLHEHLLFQLHLSVLHQEERQIGDYVIGNIDGNGYLCGTILEMAEYLGVAEERIVDVLRLIQTFDPPGVGARDLAECLHLQMKRLTIDYPLASTIISSHLAELGSGKLQKLARQLGCTPSDIQQAADFIKTLDPKPGRKLGGDSDVRYITPDVIIEKVEQEYVILVNEASVPRLTVNAQYRKLIRGGNMDEHTKSFIESKLHDAVWLIKSIEQRRRTMMKVVSCIIDLQRAFFDYGIRYLKPMTLRQIAERIAMHESTVSRATHDKYVQTPRGLFPLRFFFSSGIEQTNGQGTSAESIKQQLKELIQQEASDKPLSDQAITELFAKQDILISRRTVAKYRDELGIAASSKRRRY